MKFLHIADLHIGKAVNGFSMLDEQRHVLRQVTDQVRDESPAAVVIAGDIYDRAIPSVDAMRVFDDFLTALAEERVAVLIVAGNHYSPERLAYANRLLRDSRLYLCGTFEGKPEKVTLSDEYGVVNFWLLPFIRPYAARGLFAEREIETYGDAIAAAIDTADIDIRERNILVSHQFYTKAGLAPLRSESEQNPIGGLDAVDASLIELFDYAALGHLHGRQKAGADHICYAGSPLKYSFSEIRHVKSATLVTLGEKGNVKADQLPLSPLHDMREIKGPIEMLMREEIAALADREDYLRVILTDEDEIIDPVGKIRSVYPNVMAIDFENARTRIDISDIKPGEEQAEKLSPFTLFSQFFLETNGTEMGAAQSAIVQELLDAETEA